MLLFVFDLYIGVVAAYSSVLFMSMGGGGGGGAWAMGGGGCSQGAIMLPVGASPLASLMLPSPPPPEVIELDICFRLPPILAQIKN